MKPIQLLLLISALLAAYSLALLVMLFPWAWVALALGAGYAAAKKGRALYAHGTARWATSSDLPPNRGFLIGRMESRPSYWLGLVALLHPRVSSAAACDAFLSSLRRGRKELVRIPTTHLAVFAKTGSGKGVSCVIPHLLTNPDSCICLDPKGKNFLKTSAARRRLGNKVVCLDPFHIVTQAPDTFNPLDFIDRDSPTAIDDCDALAEALVVRSPHESEKHWSEKAVQWIGSYLACIINFHDSGCLRDVSETIANPQKSADVVRLMTQSEAYDGILAQLGHELMQPKEKELSGILSTVSRHLKFLNTPLVAANTKTTSFGPAELVNGKMTVYLVLPTRYLRSHAGLLRMWISSMLRAVVKEGLE